METSTKNRPPAPGLFVALFIIIGLAIIGVGYRYYTDQRTDLDARLRSELLTLAEARSNEVAVHRRQLDAQKSFLSGTPSLSQFVMDYRNGTVDQNLAAHLRNWIGHFQTSESLDQVCIIDPVTKKCIFFVGGTPPADVSVFVNMLDASRKRGEEFCVDAVTLNGSDSIEIHAVSPIPEDSGVGEDKRLLMVLSSSPRNKMNPIVEFWPDLSNTGEITFAVQQNNEVIIVPGNRKPGVFRSRFPVTDKNLPAARGARGEFGIMKGVDYRGVRVIAAVSPVRGSNWIVVAKIDEAEVYTHQRNDLITVLLTLLFMITAAGFALMTVWKRKENRFMLTELENNSTIQSLNRILKVGNAVNAAGLASPSRGQFINDVCRIAVEDGGYELCSVGFLESDGSVYTPYAWYGPAAAHIDSIRKAGSSLPLEGFDPTRSAVRLGTPVALNDITAEIPIEAVRSEYLRHGLRAAAVLPIRDSHKVIGGLHLYSARTNCFTTREMGLLQELAANVAFVLEKLESDDTKASAVASLVKSEARYRNLVRNMHDGLIQVDNDDRIVFVNDAFCAIAGYSREELIGKIGFDLLMPPNAREIVRRKNLDRLKGLADTYELHILTKAGTIVCSLVSGAPVFDENGTVIGSIGIFTDITERKAAEVRLSSSEQNFRALFESAAVPMLVEDSSAFRDQAIALYGIHGNRLGEYLEAHPVVTMGMIAELRVAEVNIPMVELVDAESKQQIRDNPVRFISPKSLPGMAQAIAAFAGGATRFRAQMVFVSTTGKEHQVLFAIQIAPGYENTWERVFFTAVDISDRVKIEMDLRESEERLRQFIDQTPFAIQIRDVSGKATNVNAAFERLRERLGIGDEDNALESVLQKHAPELETIFASPQATGTSIVHSVRLPIANIAGQAATEAIFDVTVFPVRSVGGNVTHLASIWQDITSNRAAEQNLRLRSAALEAAANAIVLTDVHGRIKWANPAFTAMTGYEVGEVAGMSPGEILKSGEHPAAFYKDMWDTILAGNIWQGEIINRRKDGSFYHEEMTITPLRGTDGAIQNFIAIKQDITRRRTIENEREQAVSLMKATLEATADGILVVDRDGNITGWNHRFLEMWNIPETLRTSRNDGEIIQAVVEQLADPQEFLRKVDFLYNHPEKESTELIHFKDGRTFERYSRPQVLQNEIRGRVWSFRDTSERTQAERQRIAAIEELRISEAKYHSLFTDSKDSIFMTDPKGVFTDANPSALALFGIENQVILLDSNLFDRFIRQDDRSRFLQRLTEEGHFEGADFEMTRTDGTRVFVNASATAIRDAEGAPSAFRFILRDVTRQRVMQQQLLQAQKMDSLGTLAAGIAHDFNNILTIILAHSDVVRLFLREPERIGQSIDAVQNATLRGAALVRQLLTFARKTEPLMDRVSVPPIVKDILRLLSETFPKTIEVFADMQGGLPLIMADVTQLHQVLLNLCVNARDAMPEGGKLSIRITTESVETVRLQFPQASDPRYLAVRVADTGTGMDPETRKRIFEPFFTTKESGKGTGLGLAIVFGVVQSHHGFIDVESEPGVGTSFIMYFPVPEEIVEPVLSHAADTSLLARGTETVLIIEDEDALREIIKHHLSSQGYTVHTAADGVEGLAMYLKFRDTIKVVITDLGLPKMSGVQVVKKLRSFSPQLKILVASGYISPADRSDLTNAGVVDIIQKPYVASDLLRRLRSELDRPAE